MDENKNTNQPDSASNNNPKDAPEEKQDAGASKLEQEAGKMAAKVAASAVAGPAGAAALEAAEKVPIAGAQLQKMYGTGGKGISTGLKIVSILFLIIFAMIVFITIAVFGNIRKGATGQSARQKADQNVATHRAAVNTTLAYAGDSDAKKSGSDDLVADIYANVAIIKNIPNNSAISSTTTIIRQPEANVDQSETDVLEDKTGQASSADLQVDPNAVAVDQKTRDFQSSLLAINPTDAKAPGGINEVEAKFKEWKESLPAGSGTQFQKNIGNIEKDIALLKNINSINTTPKLVIAPKDLEFIRSYDVDIRVIGALNYLVTPKSTGGAGYRKIKIRRIKADYDENNRKFDREWYEPENSDTKVISAHFDGQAFDVSAIDYAERRLFKKRVIKSMSKTEALPPVDIQVISQSGEAGKSDAFGSSVSSTGKTFGTMFENQALNELFSKIAENTGYDFSQYDIRGNNLNDAVKTIGIVALGEELGLKINPSQDNSSQELFLSNLGIGTASACLDVPAESFVGLSGDEAVSNMGREVIAKRMKLAPLSLSGGNNSNEIINSVGKRKIEKNLGIRAGSLDYLQSGDSIYVYLGQVMIEQTLNLAGGAFTGNDLGAIKQKVGEDKFNKIFSTDAGQIDSILSLKLEDADTKAFLGSKETPYQYKEKIGKTLVQSRVWNYKNHQTVEEVRVASSASKNAPAGFQTDVIGDNVGMYNYKLSADTSNQQDEALDLPEGSSATLFPQNGAFNAGVFYSIGIDEVAKRLTDIEEERQTVKLWLTQYKERPLEDIVYLKIRDIISHITDLEKKINELTARANKLTAEEKVTLEDSKKEYDKIVWIKNLTAKADPRYIDALRITPIENVKNPAREPIDSAMSDFNVAKQNYELANRGGPMGNNYDPKKIADFESQMGTAATTLIALGGKYNGSAWTFGSTDFYTVISEEYFNSSFALPKGSVSKIFRTNSGEDIFYLIGKNKIEDVDYKQKNQNKSRSASRISFIETQIKESNKRIEEMKKAGGSATDIAQYEKSVSAWEDQIRIEEGNAQNATASALELKNAAVKQEGFGTKCGSININSIIDDPVGETTRIGAGDLENALSLPSGSISDYANGGHPIGFEAPANEEATTNSDTAITTKQSYTAPGIGSKYIEETLGIPSGQFSGTNAAELMDSLGGGELAFKYFAPKNSFQNEIMPALPITASNEAWFKSIFKSTDTKLGIASGSTYDLFTDTITPAKYAQLVGDNHIGGTTKDDLASSVGIKKGGFEINSDKIKGLIGGNYIPLALSIGARTMDTGMGLPSGTTKALIENPSIDCVSPNPKTGAYNSCIANILEANGQEKLAQYMQVFSQASISDNTSEELGQTIIEKALGEIYPSPTMPIDWLVGANLKQVVENIARIENPNMMKNMAKYDKATMSGAESKLVQKFGFGRSGSSKTGLSDLQSASFTSGSTNYQIAKTIDDKLKVPVGTTAQLLQGQMTLKKYKSTVFQKHSAETAENLIFKKLFSDDTIKTLDDLGIDRPTAIEFAKDLASGGDKTAAMLELGKNKANGLIDTAGGVNSLGEVTVEQSLDVARKLGYGWFSGSSLEDVRLNIAAATNVPTALPAGMTLSYWKQTVVANNNPWIRDAERNLLGLFGVTDEKFNSIPKIAAFDFTTTVGQQTTAYRAFLAIDDKFNLNPGTTLRLFQRGVSIEDYSHKVQSAFVEHKTSMVATDLLLPDNVRDALTRHGLTIDDVINGIKNPETLNTRALLTTLSPTEKLVVFGLGQFAGGSDIGELASQMTGEYTQNVAQKKIEQVLGLVSGSFDPNSTIEAVMAANTPAKFAAAFNINMNYQQSESAISAFVKNSVMRDDQFSFYWKEALNVSRAQTVDNKLGILNPTDSGENKNPTKALLQKTISVADYIELVRKYQFSQLTKSQYLLGFATSLIDGGTGLPDDPRTQKILGYLNLADTLYGTLQDPKSLRTDKDKQVSLLNSFQSISGINLDDKAGFTPGTIEAFIKNPKDAQSLLVAEGLKGLSKNVFGDDETKNKIFANLFQYFLPGVIPGVYSESFIPDDPNSCPLSAKDVTEVDAYNIIANKRSKCGQFILNTTLNDFIEQITTIKSEKTDRSTGQTTEGDVIVPGFRLPDEDLENLKKGDFKIFTAMSITTMINKVAVQKDSNGDNFQIMPEGFRLDYNDVAKAWGLRSSLTVGEESRIRSNDFPELYAKQHGSVPFLAGPELDNYYKEQDTYLKEKATHLKTDARKNIMYSYMDAQLMATVKVRDVMPILPGFTQAMFSGSAKTRNNMIVAVGINYALQAGGIFGQDVLENTTVMAALNTFVTTRDMNVLTDLYNDPAKRDQLIFGAVDQAINKKFGIDLPSGTAQNLYQYVTTGDFSPNFKDLGEEYIQGKIGGIVDEQLGLPSGTSYQAYKLYKAYDAGTMSKGDLIMLAVQLVFGKQLAQLDAAIGLPPGSMSALISALVYGGPIAWAMFAFTVLTGFVKIEMQITCPGDPSFMAGGPTGSWCKAEEEMPQLLTSWAQINTRRLIEDMLRIDEANRTNDGNLFPTIMGTFRKEDVDYFHGKTVLPNGKNSENLADTKFNRHVIFRGMRDLWQSDTMGSFVHVGY